MHESFQNTAFYNAFVSDLDIMWHFVFVFANRVAVTFLILNALVCNVLLCFVDCLLHIPQICRLLPIGFAQVMRWKAMVTQTKA